MNLTVKTFSTIAIINTHVLETKAISTIYVRCDRITVFIVCTFFTRNTESLFIPIRNKRYRIFPRFWISHYYILQLPQLVCFQNTQSLKSYACLNFYQEFFIRKSGLLWLLYYEMFESLKQPHKMRRTYISLNVISFS